MFRSSLVLEALHAYSNQGCGAVVGCARKRSSETHFRSLRYAGFAFTVLSTILVPVSCLKFRASYVSSHSGATYTRIIKFESVSTKKFILSTPKVKFLLAIFQATTTMRLMISKGRYFNASQVVLVLRK
jgi:hypothetical protein